MRVRITRAGRMSSPVHWAAGRRSRGCMRHRSRVASTVRPIPGGLMRSLSFFVVACCFTSVACTADRATAPSTFPSSGAPSVASSEGAEAAAAAHLDLREVRAELLAVDRAYAEAARSVNLIDALVAPLAPDAVFLAPGPVILRGPDAARGCSPRRQATRCRNGRGRPFAGTFRVTARKATRWATPN